ncbi:MAG: hypothetical protein AAF985_22940, partial [Bacteroidota bacterium]
FFRNIKTVHLKASDPKIGFASEREWANSFIENYSKKLNKPYRKAYYLYAKSLYYFLNKEFDNAFSLLVSNVSYQQATFINIDTRILYLQVLFELEIQGHALTDENQEEIELGQEIQVFRKMVSNLKRKKVVINDQDQHYHQFYLQFNGLYTLFIRYFRVYKKDDQVFINKKQELLKKVKEKSYSFTQWMLSKIEKI